MLPIKNNSVFYTASTFISHMKCFNQGFSLSKPLLSESLLCSDWSDGPVCCDWSTLLWLVRWPSLSWLVCRDLRQFRIASFF